MTRNANPRTSTPRTATPAVDAAPKVDETFSPVPNSGPTLALRWGTAGRPDASRAAIVAAGFDHLAAALAAYKPAPAAKAPANAPRRIRAAFEAVAADDAAALSMIRKALANGRAATR